MKPELLLPAGDLERLDYACAYGADAIYIGAPRYSLRVRENGFVTNDSIMKAIDHAHRAGKKIYIAMNIFPHNNKIEGMLDSFCELEDYGPDGFIVADIGIISKMLSLRPKAIIHLSTQANATNWATAQFYHGLGVKRIVIPRELSLKEIQQIHDKVPAIELEAFVHGSMCMAYSGRCLISNYLTHRDSNQGNCANSCRWQYRLSSTKGSLKVVEEEFQPASQSRLDLNETHYVTERNRPEQRFELDEDENGTYLFNSKDLCAIEILKNLRDAGVISFKVEGRTKSLYYTSIVARAYRQALDDLMEAKPFNRENLEDLIGTSNRSLMTGFLLRRPEEYGQNYTDGGSHPLTHLFIGRVDRYDADQKIAWVEFRNKVSVGDVVECVSPNSSERIHITRLISHQGQELESISGGVVGGLSTAVEPPSFAILRKKIEITSN